MKLIVDANILFAALIKQEITTDLLLDLSLDLHSPEFILEEFVKHKQEILSKTNRTEQKFNKIFNIIKKIITFVPIQEFEDYFNEAEKISPDPNDVAYFALALKLKCPIWSNDKRLKKQNKIKVYSTKNLINNLK